MKVVSSCVLKKSGNSKTSQRDAWADGFFETYEIGVEIPAVRIHSRAHHCGGRWYSVDSDGMWLSQYQDKFAITRSDGLPCTLKHPEVDYYVMLPGSKFNVGVAAEKGDHSGGGLQFEHVAGPRPLQIGHFHNVRKV
jgi:hypothetical protein